MLYEEAQWVGNNLLKITKAKDRILNLGSSTLHARTIGQPHMEEFIFGPLREKNVVVAHSDITNDEGVDLQGDFTDPIFIEKLKSMNFDGVICCNLLEHLEERKPLVEALNTIIPRNGWLLLTVPRQYPYHLDPIDTMYRPSPDELCELFSNFEATEREIVLARRHVMTSAGVKFHKNYMEQLNENPKLRTRLLLRLFFPFYKYSNWKITAKDLRTRKKPFSVSCIVLKKN